MCADLPTGFAPAGGAQRTYWRAHDRMETDGHRTCIHHAAFISIDLEGPVTPTDCTTIRITGEVGGMQWEEGDEWRLRRAHALDMAVQPVPEIGKKEHR